MYWQNIDSTSYLLDFYEKNANQIFYYTRCITPKRKEFAAPISVSLRPSNTAPFEKRLQ